MLAFVLVLGMGNPKGVERNFDSLEQRRLKGRQALSTVASGRVRCPGNLGFTASRSVGGIKRGENKEPRRSLKRAEPVVKRGCSPLNWSN